MMTFLLPLLTRTSEMIDLKILKKNQKFNSFSN